MVPKQITGTQIAEIGSANGRADFNGVALRGLAGQEFSVGFSGSSLYRTLTLQSSVSLGEVRACGCVEATCFYAHQVRELENKPWLNVRDLSSCGWVVNHCRKLALDCLCRGGGG